MAKETAHSSGPKIRTEAVFALTPGPLTNNNRES
jgi:hypothetical protein